MEQPTFENAVLDVVKLAVSPTNDEKLQIYGLFKQATIGNINIPAPGFFDFAGAAKWKAWNSMNGKTTDDAKKEYVDLVKSLTDKYGQKIEIQTV